MPGVSAAPYCRSVATARARLRSLFTTTISRASPRNTADRSVAAPTAPAPTTPIFRASPMDSPRLGRHHRLFLFSQHADRLRIHSQVRLHQFGWRQRHPLVEGDVGVVAALEHLEKAKRRGAGVL